MKRPLLAELHRTQADMGAEAGRPVTLGELLRVLLDSLRASQRPARPDAGSRS